MNELENFFFNQHHRLIHKWNHYFEIYERHLKHLKDTKINLLEIGISHGGSLQMWDHYFNGNAMIYAVDINPDAIRYIDARAKKEHLANITTILAKPDDPHLPSKVNAVLVLKTYHEIAAPVSLLRNLRPSLTPDARLGVIDRNGNGADHGIAKEVVIQEADEAGYRLLEQYDFVKDGMDYFLVFGLK